MEGVNETDISAPDFNITGVPYIKEKWDTSTASVV
jgi:hypothetical protein